MLNWYIILCKLTKTFIILSPMLINLLEPFFPQMYIKFKNSVKRAEWTPYQMFQWPNCTFLSPLQVAWGLKGGNEHKFIFPLRVHRQTAQSIWESLVGTNKLIGLNSKYVFPPHASLWDYTHPEDAVSQAYTHKHTTTTLPAQSKHSKSSCTVRYFLFEVWCSKYVVYGVGCCWMPPLILGSCPSFDMKLI